MKSIFSFFRKPVPQIVSEELGNVSNKYTKISTNDLCNSLTKQGFEVSKIMQGTGKKSGFHIVRMKWNKEMTVNGDKMFPEVVIENSFNGKHAFKVKAGVFRLVCTNGLTIAIQEFGEFKIRHTGSADKIAKEITMEFAKRIPQIIQTVEKMQETTLTEEQAIQLAMNAARSRWEKEFTPKQAKQLLSVARPEDGGYGLWEVYNRVQENILNGTKIDGVRMSAKPIKSAQRYENINTEIFESAFEFVN